MNSIKKAHSMYCPSFTIENTKKSSKSASRNRRRNATIGLIALTTILAACCFCIENKTDDNPNKFLNNTQFSNKYFPLSKKDMWDDQQGSFVLENQIDKMAGLIEDALYKGYVGWIATQYDTCAVEVKKFMDKCPQNFNLPHSPDCDEKFQNAQDACSDAKEAGETFCSKTIKETTELKEFSAAVEPICEQLGLSLNGTS